MIIAKSANPKLFSLLPNHLSFLIKSKSIKFTNVPVVLDGPKGIGKSCALSLIAHDWLNQGGLVMHESAIPFVDGSYPYSKLGDHFDTPMLSMDIISRFKSLNNFDKDSHLNNLLKKLKLENSSLILKDLLDYLANSQRFLLVIDQANALYSKSCYFDEDSNQLHSHKLNTANIFQEYIKVVYFYEL